jgi:hypothetical protein
MILAGIFLNMCVCGALMRDLKWTSYRAKQKRQKRKERGTSFDSFSITTSTNNGTISIGGENNGGVGVDLNIVEAIAEDDPHLFSSLINLPTFAKNGEKVSHISILFCFILNKFTILYFFQYRFQLEFLNSCQKIEIFMMFSYIIIHICLALVALV